MRNALSYMVGREMGAAVGRWAPRTRYVEVYLDGDYRGLYLLVEHIKRDKTRVPIRPPAPDAATGDITGGYMFSQEGDGSGHTGESWTDPLYPRAKLVYRYPKYMNLTPAQKSYLPGAVETIFRAVAKDPTWAAASKRLEPVSWLDYALMQELTNNVDGYWKSWWFTKMPDPMGGLLYAGPIWDFDLGYGNIIIRQWYCATLSASRQIRAPFDDLWKDPGFQNDLRCRWNTLRAAGGPLDVAHIEMLLDAFGKHIATAKARDIKRWKNIGFWVWPNNYIGATWENEVAYLRYWIHQRLAWLDKSLPGTCASVPAPSAVSKLPSPPAIEPRNAREPYAGRDAPVYIPIEGPVPAQYSTWGCPK
jgi:hypothetical protein